MSRSVEAPPAWCDAEGIPRKSQPLSTPAHEKTFLEFEEHFSGGHNGIKYSLRIDVKIEDLDAFITQPEHQAEITGDWNGELLTGQLQLLADAGNPSTKQIRYRLSSPDLTLPATRHIARGVSTRDLEVSLNQKAQSFQMIFRSGIFETWQELAIFPYTHRMPKHGRSPSSFRRVLFRPLVGRLRPPSASLQPHLAVHFPAPIS